MSRCLKLTTLLPTLTVLPALLLPSTGAAADWSVGLGAAYSQSAYHDYQDTLLPIPLIGYQGEHWFIRGLGVGYQFYDSHQQDSPFGTKADMFITRASQSFDPEKSGVLSKLNQRRASIDAGFSVTSSQIFGQFSLSLQTDASGAHGGQSVEVGYGFPLFLGKNFSAFGQVGADWHSTDWTGYYFGISDSEAAVTDFSAYSPTDVINPTFGMFATYKITTQWRAQAGLSRTWLDDNLRASPMVSKIQQDGVFVGLTYAL